MRLSAVRFREAAPHLGPQRLPPDPGRRPLRRTGQAVRVKPLLALAAVLLVAGCGSDAPARAPLTQEQACAQAEQVTDRYQDALGDAGTPEAARSVIDGAIEGLREIETDAPVGARIDALVEALEDLLAGVEAGTPPAQLRPQATALGASTTALARACGRQGG